MVILNTRYHFETRGTKNPCRGSPFSFSQRYSSLAQSRFSWRCQTVFGFVVLFCFFFRFCSSSSASSSSYFVTRAIGFMMTFDQQRARGIKYSIQLVYARTSPILSRRRNEKKNIYRLLLVVRFKFDQSSYWYAYSFFSAWLSRIATENLCIKWDAQSFADLFFLFCQQSICLLHLSHFMVVSEKVRCMEWNATQRKQTEWKKEREEITAVLI